MKLKHFSPKRPLLSILCIFMSSYLFAADEKPKQPQAKLTEVTVFPYQCRLKRVFTKTLTPGKSTIVLDDLEYGLAANSVQVRSLSDGVKIALVEVSNTHHKQVLSKQAKELREMIDAEEEKIAALKIQNDILTKKTTFLKNIEIGRRPYGKSEVAVAPLNTNSWGKVLDDLSTEESKTNKLKRFINKEIDNRLIELNVLIDRIQRLKYYEVMARKKVSIHVNATGGKTDFEISYQVAGPSWFPNYLTRVNRKDKSVELTCFGVVYQGTGYDWQNVNLRLSSSNPSSGLAIPQINAWYLREANPMYRVAGKGKYDREYKKRRAGRKEKQITDAVYSKKGIKNMPGNYADMGEIYNELKKSGESLEVMFGEKSNSSKDKVSRSRMKKQLKEMRREVKSSPKFNRRGQLQNQLSNFGYFFGNLRRDLRNIRVRTVVASTKNVQHYEGYTVVSPHSTGSWYDQEFSTQTPASVASTSEPVRLTLAKHTFETDFVHIIRPNESLKAYLVARAKNNTGKTWLAGGMRVFFQNDYVGRSQFKALGEEGIVALSLGVDENVKVTRNAVSKEEKKGVFSSDRKRLITISIEVKNKTDASIDCEIEEMLPRVRTPKVSFKIKDYGTGDGIVRDHKIENYLHYKVSLKAGETRKLIYSYEIIYPKNFKLQGFRP